jgi:hypothetical protein
MDVQRVRGGTAIEGRREEGLESGQQVRAAFLGGRFERAVHAALEHGPEVR